MAAMTTNDTADHVSTEGDTHLIRVCLDLQLDAMLLAVRAVAGQPASGDEVDPSDDASRPPAATWQRWMVEDLQMVCALAADVLRGGAALPPTLGSDPVSDAPSAAVDHLAARYESMDRLLTGVVDAADRTGPAAGIGTVRDALARCRQRLAELTRTGPYPAPDVSPVPSSPEPVVSLPEPALRRYLPGELLG